ncbi:hypothetical protein ACSMX9_13395 [Streptomyces sp. LE64]|uniref:hypothetical protein n=1 Tax=Streptomyces sp. LE64 TaxID=3448653 RepID=UPI004041711B
MSRRFRDIDWELKQMESDKKAHVQCISGTPRCGAVPPGRPGSRSWDDVLTWTEEHFRLTGHRRYDRVVFDLVQWDPPQDAGPRSLPDATT